MLQINLGSIQRIKDYYRACNSICGSTTKLPKNIRRQISMRLYLMTEMFQYFINKEILKNFIKKLCIKFFGN